MKYLYIQNNILLNSIMESDNFETDVELDQNELSDTYETQSVRDNANMIQPEQHTKCPNAKWGFSFTDHNFSTVGNTEKKNIVDTGEPKNGDMLVFDADIGEYRTLKNKEKASIGNTQ